MVAARRHKTVFTIRDCIDNKSDDHSQERRYFINYLNHDEEGSFEPRETSKLDKCLFVRGYIGPLHFQFEAAD